MTKSFLLKKLIKTRACDRGRKLKIVIFCDRHNCHTLSVTGTNPVSVSVLNLDRNCSKDFITTNKQTTNKRAATRTYHDNKTKQPAHDNCVRS